MLIKETQYVFTAAVAGHAYQPYSRACPPPPTPPVSGGSSGPSGCQQVPIYSPAPSPIDGGYVIIGYTTVCYG